MTSRRSSSGEVDSTGLKLLDGLRVFEGARELAASGMTMIIVTHEIGFAREISSRMVFMMDGAIVVDGPPKEFLKVLSSQG